MSQKKRRIHLDATRPGQRFRAALCGWTVNVETETDVSRVTCQACLRRFRGSVLEQRRALADGLLAARDQIPRAGPPPRLDARTWQSVCRPHERRCGVCPVCSWEAEAEKYRHAYPDGPPTGVVRRERPTVWPSLREALRALVEHELHGRWGPSASGFILDRARRGDLAGDGGRGRSDDPQMQRGGELVRVRKALDVAYPDGGHELLTAASCKAVLLLRTPGVTQGPMLAYEALVTELGAVVTVGQLKALVRAGKRAVTVELAARGLIPAPMAWRGMAEDVERARGRLKAYG